MHAVGPPPQRVRRILEAVYGVQGVVAVRAWCSPGKVAVGVRGGAATGPHDLLSRVEAAVAGLREAGESWDFGILGDEV